MTIERALEMCKANKLHRVFETSAKTGDNVEELFATVARELYVQAREEAAKPEPPIAPPGGGGIGLGDNNNPKTP